MGRQNHYVKVTPTTNYATKLEHNCQDPVLIRVSPLYETSHRTTSWVDKPTHNVHNHCVTQLEHNCQSSVNTPFRAPYSSGVHPPKHKQQLCGQTQPLCGLIDLKTLLENNFQGPKFLEKRKMLIGFEQKREI